MLPSLIHPRIQRFRPLPPCGDHGVVIKIITGDNEVVTRKICKEVGLPNRTRIAGQVT